MKNLLINNLEFARKSLEISGELDSASCKRLVGFLISPERSSGRIQYRLVGFTDAINRPCIHLQLDAHLPVLCQRCLEEMLLDITLEFNYLITDSAPMDAGDDVDWLEANQEFDLIELIEDELLAALPIAPVHDTSCMSVPMQSGEKPNPFAALKGRFK